MNNALIYIDYICVFICKVVRINMNLRIMNSCLIFLINNYRVERLFKDKEIENSNKVKT